MRNTIMKKRWSLFLLLDYRNIVSSWCFSIPILGQMRMCVYKNSSRNSPQHIAPNPSGELFNFQSWGKRLSSVDSVLICLCASVPETLANNSPVDRYSAYHGLIYFQFQPGEKNSFLAPLQDETNKPYIYVQRCKVNRLIKILKGIRKCFSYLMKLMTSVLAKHQL